MVGSNTPVCLFSQGLPVTKSRPIHFRLLHSGSTWASFQKALNFAMRSMEFEAALSASVLGIIRRDLANSAIAICFLRPSWLYSFQGIWKELPLQHPHLEPWVLTPKLSSKHKDHHVKSGPSCHVWNHLPHIIDADIWALVLF